MNVTIHGISIDLHAGDPMFSLFKEAIKSNTDKTIEELNKLTSPYTQYAWAYTKKDDYTKKNGFYLSFSSKGLSGDVLQKFIENSFKEQGFTTHIIGNGFNAEKGTRLIIESSSISLEKIEIVKLSLQQRMQDGDPEVGCKLQ